MVGEQPADECSPSRGSRWGTGIVVCPRGKQEGGGVRLRQALSLAKREIRAVIYASRISGWRTALIDRHDVDPTRVDALEAILAALEAASTRAEALEAGIETRMAALEARVEAEAARIDDANEALGKLERALQLRLSENDRHAGTRVTCVADTSCDRIHRTSPDRHLSSCLHRPGDSEQVLSAPIGDRLRSPQVYPHWELVAVDDGSTDGTRALLAELAAEDDRIVVISQPHHGAGAAAMQDCRLRAATSSATSTTTTRCNPSG